MFVSYVIKYKRVVKVSHFIGSNSFSLFQQDAQYSEYFLYKIILLCRLYDITSFRYVGQVFLFIYSLIIISTHRKKNL